MGNPIDLLLIRQGIQGYEDPQTVLECWTHFCYYKLMGFQPEETDPEELLRSPLSYFWND